jgi:hypothetical protein
MVNPSWFFDPDFLPRWIDLSISGLPPKAVHSQTYAVQHGPRGNPSSAMSVPAIHTSGFGVFHGILRSTPLWLFSHNVTLSDIEGNEVLMLNPESFCRNFSECERLLNFRSKQEGMRNLRIRESRHRPLHAVPHAARSLDGKAPRRSSDRRGAKFLGGIRGRIWSALLLASIGPTSEKPKTQSR